jgi:dTDP-4-amino-4,6-dideoxygalactose transaminase
MNHKITSSIFVNILQIIRSQFKSSYFTFAQGHSYLTNDEIQDIEHVLHNPNLAEGIIKKYEYDFAKLVGKGQACSFATGRMAFYSVMKSLKIGTGDEVILLGFTCAVMANAVLKRGATPIYSDIDPETMGSSPESIVGLISKDTKMIVAQHSFGIPCRIDEISIIAKDKGIFLLEDCALSLSSKRNGISVGNWGDAAIFSTDNTKPLNTHLGGMLYSNNQELYNRILEIRNASDSIPYDYQIGMFNDFIFNKKYLNPKNYKRVLLIRFLEKFKKLINKQVKKNYNFEEDFETSSEASLSYPYPAKLPGFLAVLGLIEVSRWGQVLRSRKETLNEYLTIIVNTKYKKYIPKVYFDNTLEIVPLRMILVPESNKKELNDRIKKYIDIYSFWFKEPIIGTSNDLELLNYRYSSCKISERIGKTIINIPIAFDDKFRMQILKKLKRI